ncbi:hypothetical protein MMC19_005158 [Ptychographa xylographoides]|nr:hypothetical protein [Ptychographa xylographoides]
MPSNSNLATAAAGVVFGAALTASAVYSPNTIVGQMQLQDFHMLKVFLAASASSALIIPLLNSVNLAETSPRCPSTINLFGPYDANILGGAVLGAGMTLTGACPGTVLAQVATGITSGFFVLAGAVLGGILWSRFGSRIKNSPSTASGSNSSSSPTVPSVLKLSLPQTLVAFETLCATLLLGLELVAKPGRPAPISAPVGGLLIGIAQGTSLLFTGNTLGVSTVYEEAGHWFWHVLPSTKHTPSSSKTASTPTTPPPGPFPGAPSTHALSFAAGILAGSFAFTHLAPASLLATPSAAVELEIGRLTAVMGGCLMVFGARLAGGCTSGHGISGMATMGVASFVSVTAVFAGGMGVAAMLG